MSEQERTLSSAETEAYLARIRETIKKSELLIEQAELRIRETDRLLEEQGLTREDVAHLLDGVEVPAELRERIEAELAAQDGIVEEERRAALARLQEERGGAEETGSAEASRHFGPLMRQFRL